MKKLMHRQMENVKKLQRALRCKLSNQFYTKYLSKANAKVKQSLQEETKKQIFLKSQLKESRDQYRKNKINIRLINQQAEQLEQELDRKNFQRILFYELSHKLQKGKNQFQRNTLYGRIIEREKQLKSNRKTIDQYLLEIHKLFIQYKERKLSKYKFAKNTLNMDLEQNKNLLHIQTIESQELYEKLQNLEKDYSVSVQKKQKCKLYQQNLTDYLFLRQQYLQIQNSSNQVYQAQDEKLKQRCLCIFSELKQIIDKAEQMTNQNMNQDGDDLKFMVLQQIKVKEYNQVCNERINLKQQKKLKFRQQLDEYEKQIQEIKLVLVKQIPQIDTQPDEVIQRGLDNIKTKKMSNLDLHISKCLSQIEEIKKVRCNSLKIEEEYQKIILKTQKLIKEKDRPIKIESHKLKKIQLKFNSLQLKSNQSKEQFLAGHMQINIDLDSQNKKKFANKIQKKLETFISEIDSEILDSCSFEQHLKQQLNKYKEDLDHLGWLREKKQISEYKIQKFIKKYKQQKQRIKRRSLLFDLVICQ